MAVAVVLFVPAAAAERSVGTIEGRVVDATSGNFLNNARVVVRGTAGETTTNDLGGFRLADLPVGEAQVTVTFAGMEPQVATVRVVAGQTTPRDFSLTLAGQAVGLGKAVQLDAYTVVEREMIAQAIALQERRGAPNLKTVISLDEFGDMGEGNIGEYLKFVPGLTMSYNPQTPGSAGARSADWSQRADDTWEVETPEGRVQVRLEAKKLAVIGGSGKSLEVPLHEE